ncbi:hypothetical protein MLD38_013561 [Melastoma candidum]|uniref:Uncharacterized protein n=1 Tax=Melastoma candidum TaxID=119954 RepID=A0ACB9RA24_9MYRT|nr:hypothetical protein MLD38_013561 [Melastoma candidum]
MMPSSASAALGSLSCPPALTHYPLVNRSSVRPYNPLIPISLRPSCSSASVSPPSGAAASPASKKVLIPIGYGTEEMEAVVMIDVLRRAGAEVTVASVEPQLQVEASGGIRIVADTSISKCRNQLFDLVALPGGMPGSVRLRDCEILRQITSRQADGKRLYGAICAAPAVTLLPWGLLKRKQITCHPAFHDKLPTFWAVKSNIQVSGELTTSRGPGTSFEFALSLVEQLFGGTVAGEVGESLLLSDVDIPSSRELNKVEWTFNRTPRVLIPMANGSEAIEVVTIADVLRRAKIDVVLASVGNSQQILASQNTRIMADKLISDAAAATYDLIILPGGKAGAESLYRSRTLKRLLKEQNLSGRICGAICPSPAEFRRKGLPKDSRADAQESGMIDSNSEGRNAAVMIDGNVITSRGLASATEFALTIISKLFGVGRARSVAEGLVFEYMRSSS